LRHCCATAAKKNCTQITEHVHPCDEDSTQLNPVS